MHVKNGSIYYRENPRAKRVSLKVDNARRRVIVTYPGRRHRKAAEAFVAEKADWLAVQLEALPKAQPFKHGGDILFRGERYLLLGPEGRGRPRAEVSDEGRFLIVPAPEGTLAGRTERFLKREARAALEEAVEKYCAAVGRPVRGVTVRDTASRWGSCSSDGNLNFSWRLICAPPYVLDYVAAHECAHLVHHNHSRAFWALTRKICPETDRAERWMKSGGPKLFAVGAER